MNIKYRKSLKLIALLITSLLIATVSAAAYVNLQWTMTATVAANPKVCFFWWSNSTKVNTFDYAVNIFPSIKTIDENITCGVWNLDTASHAASMRWYLLTDTGNIARLYIKVYNTTTTIYEKEWTSIPGFPTEWQKFTPDPMANGKYKIWIEITATSGASGGSVFTFEMKVENP